MFFLQVASPCRSARSSYSSRVMRMAVKRKGCIIIRTKPDLYHPPSPDVTVNSFSTGSQPVAMYRNQDITREAAAPPPPPPPDPSFHPILRHSFLFLLRRVFPPSPAYPKGIRNNSSNSSRGNWVNLYAEPRHGKVGTIGEGKTYKQISLPPPLRYDLVLLFFFSLSLSLSLFLFSLLSFLFIHFQRRI